MINKKARLSLAVGGPLPASYQRDYPSTPKL